MSQAFVTLAFMEIPEKSDRNGSTPVADGAGSGAGPGRGSAHTARSEPDHSSADPPRLLHDDPGASALSGEVADVDRDEMPDGAGLGCVDAAFRALRNLSTAGLTLQDCENLATGLGRLRSRVDSLLCAVGKRIGDLDPDVDAGEVLRQSTRMNTRDAREMIRVGEQLGEMPNVSERFSTGAMTFRHAAALTRAAAKVGADKVDGTDVLVGLSATVPADTFARRVNVWTTRTILESGADPLDMQHRARRGTKWSRWADGMKIFRAELDPVRGALVEKILDDRYRALLMADSAGCQDPDKMRTPVQRMADAYFEVITRRDALTGEALSDAGPGRVPLAQLVVKVDLAELDGVGATGQCEVIGAGPVPRRILETLSPDTELVAMIFAGDGRGLWMGRKRRLGNAAQRLAVAIRDGGCFKCGAPMHRCQLHHIHPWKRGGGTDIDNLVAVCPRHHKWITDRNLHVERIPGGWQTRPRDGPDRAAA